MNDKKMNSKINKENDLYWQDIHNKNPSDKELAGEFRDGELDGFFKESSHSSRRDFFKIMGFSFATVPLATGCLRIPIKKALPFLKGSENVTPGLANWYATYQPYFNGGAILVKTREGRAIKVEGNPLSESNRGGTSAISQASILSLYDANRFDGDIIKSQKVTFDKFDNELRLQLKAAQELNKKNYLITDSIKSPSTLALIEEFSKQFNVKHIVYEPYFLSSQNEANHIVFGKEANLQYVIEKSELVIAFNRDFIGSDNKSVEFTKQYSKAKAERLEGRKFKHIQLESLMSLTGSNADERYTISDFDELEILAMILENLSTTNQSLSSAQNSHFQENQRIAKKISEQLKLHLGKSIVISGTQDLKIQLMVARINQSIKSYGNSIVVYEEKYHKLFNEQTYQSFVEDIVKSNAGVLIFWDCNPLHSDHRQEQLITAIKKSQYSVSIASSPNETTEHCHAVAAQLNFLESYCEYFEYPETLYFSQAVMNPLFPARQGQEVLLNLMGKSDWYTYWKQFLNAKFSIGLKWDSALHDGLFKISSRRDSLLPLASSDISQMRYTLKEKPNLKTYMKYSIGDGRFTNNPWLLELPDPITKVTWENYLVISPKYAKSHQLQSGNIVSLKVHEQNFQVPVLVQPGTEEQTFALAVGFGRSRTGKAAQGRGVNASFIHSNVEGRTQFNTSHFSIEKTGKSKTLAQTQTHHSMEGRDIVRETGLNEYRINPQAGNPSGIKLISLWGGHEKKGQQWGLVIDLDKCTGCSGCVISCNAENNVPVVGPEEVTNRREMHWMRLDRYYKGDENNPEVVHQPVMCQHCDNAPCESVCPVLATVQSSDGLNQQVYNRCVGTRYCANNCPYKVRRFNWFDYPHDDKYENMVLNPDIVVRSRGVMEKCSMCVQRIQESRLKAKMEGRELLDGEIKMACEQSCPADAIVFGDINDKKSRIYKLLNNKRNYTLLQELNVMPRVQYLTKIRNKD